MYSKVVLTTALLATAASASNFMIHPQKRDALLQARQTGLTDISTECQTALLEVYTSIPTPPPEIMQDMVTNIQTDPCSFSTPASLSKEYASYSSQVVSWISANEAQISSILSECPALTQLATMVPVCETDLGDKDSTKTGEAGSKSTGTVTGTAADKTTAAAGTGTTAAASGTGTAAPSATKNAAYRETGMAIMAAAAAGFIGAVAAL